MIHIKRFIDRVSLLEARQVKDFVIPLADARALRDELAKILLDCCTSNTEKKDDLDKIIKIEVKGRSFK